MAESCTNSEKNSIFHFKNKDAQLFFIHLAFMFFTTVVFV